MSAAVNAGEASGYRAGSLTKTTSAFSHLECAQCSKKFPTNKLLGMCPDCTKPLLARYDLDQIAKTLTKEELKKRDPALGLWRYEEFLPVQFKENIISLGEGWTPLFHAEAYGKLYGIPNTWIKDESKNPTGSFKARGAAVCVSRAYELGAKALAIATNGNAGGAMACYAAQRNIPGYVFMPEDAWLAFKVECKVYGMNVTTINGFITDCGAKVREGAKEHGWFDVCTLREPFRVEGKKTMGIELLEQFDWKMPDVIIYPTGGGTGLIGMWKAFNELQHMGWIGSERPKMVSVQSDGCAPIVRAWNELKDKAEPWKDARTVASGLRVPAAAGDFLILEALKKSNGTALAVSDEAMKKSCETVARVTGIWPSVEAGAVFAGFEQLSAQGWIKPTDKVVLFLTGTGLKYPQAWL